MTAAEKNQLQIKRERFLSLAPEIEQAKIRELHQQIQSHPESEKLLATMNRYNEWLMTLTVYQRAELLKLPKKERIAHIKSLETQLLK